MAAEPSHPRLAIILHLIAPLNWKNCFQDLKKSIKVKNTKKHRSRLFFKPGPTRNYFLSLCLMYLWTIVLTPTTPHGQVI